ncbi:hypothetical protein [Dickeya dadantii]|uniref:hypothetical protein n=1 Tax=Dickeya dadantii TaxID=204038 RepID=UPI000B2B46B6
MVEDDVLALDGHNADDHQRNAAPFARDEMLSRHLMIFPLHRTDKACCGFAVSAVISAPTTQANNPDTPWQDR